MLCASLVAFGSNGARCQLTECETRLLWQSSAYGNCPLCWRYAGHDLPPAVVETLVLRGFLSEDGTRMCAVDLSDSAGGAMAARQAEHQVRPMLR